MSNPDPLEAAKVVAIDSKTTERKPGRPPREQPLVAMPVPTAEDTIRPDVLEAAKTVIEPPPLAPATPEEKPRSYRVLESRTFMWGGYVTHLNTGGVVSESGYGKAGIQNMLNQGFKLKDITDEL